MRLLFVVVLLSLAGCGGGIPRLASPADGTVIDLNNPGWTLQATLQDNNYDGVTIQLAGDYPTNEVWCQSYPYSGMQCTRNYNGQMGGGGFQCNPSCTALVIAQRGDQRDVRWVKFTRGTQQPVQ